MTNKKRLFQLKGGLMIPVKEETVEIKPVSLSIKSKIKRKTITIQESEYNEWMPIKGEYSWTTLLKTVREGYQFFKQVMGNLTVKIESGAYNSEIVGKPSKRSMSSGRVQNLKPNSPKALVLAEIRKATEGNMSIEEFRGSLLKPLTEKELLNIQKSDAELEKAQNKDICLGDLKPPK